MLEMFPSFMYLVNKGLYSWFLGWKSVGFKLEFCVNFYNTTKANTMKAQSHVYLSAVSALVFCLDRNMLRLALLQN
jgi:hypothetical protein